MFSSTAGFIWIKDLSWFVNEMSVKHLQFSSTAGFIWIKDLSWFVNEMSVKLCSH